MNDTEHVLMKGIELTNGNRLSAEIMNLAPSCADEMCVGITDKDGRWLQDLVALKEIGNGKIQLLIWGDADDEDYTDRRVIEQYKGA